MTNNVSEDNLSLVSYITGIDKSKLKPCGSIILRGYVCGTIGVLFDLDNSPVWYKDYYRVGVQEIMSDDLSDEEKVEIILKYG